MSKTYQVHIKTVGQMKALLKYYKAKGFNIGDSRGADDIALRYLKLYPWPVIYPNDKEIGGNEKENALHTTIPFDQAFDLPVKKESVEFCASAVNWKVEKNTCICNFDKALGDRAFMFDPERLIAQLQSALDELDND